MVGIDACRRLIVAVRLSAGGHRLIYSVEIFAVGVEIIDAFFVPDPEKDKDTAGDAQGKAERVDGGVSFVTDDITPGDSEIAF